LSASLRRALAALLLLVLAGQTVRAVQRLRASQLTGEVQRQVTAARQRGQLPGGLLRGGLAALARARELDPVAVEPRTFEGDLLLLVGREAAAAELYRDAARHELRPETLLHLGHALWAEGQRREAVEHWRRVQVLAPRLVAGLPVPPEVLAAEPPRPLPPDG
jgi:Flp pilus assembly protein TadD